LKICFEIDLASDCYPVAVSAFLDGEVRQMTKISSNKWSEVEWPYQPSRVETIANYYCRDEIIYEDVTLGLVLEFESASETHLADQYAKVLENQKMGDVKFILQGQEMTAHSDILIAASPVMAAMLEDGKFTEGQTKTITIPDIEPTVFKQLLWYIYTGSAPSLGEESIMMPLYLAADKYQLDALKKICEEGLIQNLKLENAVVYLSWAYSHLLPKLKEASANFLIKHRREKELWAQPEWKELSRSHQKAFHEITCKMMSAED
jgi:speckle-type POZ protein